MHYTIPFCKFSEKLMLCFLLFIFGCQPDDSHFEPSGEVAGRIIDQLELDPDFSTFVAGLERTGLDQFVGRSGLWTVIAPTNQAFSNAGISFESISDEELSQLLEFHILESMMFTFDFAVSKFSSNVQYRYATLSEKYVNVAQDGNAVNGISFIEGKKNIEALNGAIHGVNEVLFPDPSIDIYLEEQPNLSTFFAALQEYAQYEVDGENSIDTNNDGIYDDTVFLKSYTLPIDLVDEAQIKTVYAPTNAAFEAFFADPAIPYNSLDDFDPSNTVDQYVLTALLTAHLTSGLQASNGTIPTSGGENVTIAPEDVQTGDITQSNGVIHILDKIVYPPSFSSLSGRALLDKDLSDFATALIKATLIDDYMDISKNFTVFAPTNAAFDLAGINPANEDVTALLLEPILRYHVVGDNRLIVNDLAGKIEFLPTVNGTFFKHDGTGLFDPQGNAAGIVIGDVTASNGVLHKIDNLLHPPATTVSDLILNNNNFDQFEAALTRAGLVEELRNSGITVFAPTNQAFFELYEYLETPGGLTDISVPRLDSILRYHILPSRAFSTNLEHNTALTTQLSDRQLMVQIQTDSITLADGDEIHKNAVIVTTDDQGTNGVFHTIDAVLLPEKY